MLEWSQHEADGQLLISTRLCNVDYKINYLGTEPPITCQKYDVLPSSISSHNWQSIIPLNTQLVLCQLVPLCLAGKR